MLSSPDGLQNPRSAFDVSLIATQYRSAPLQRFFQDLNADISMLHPDVLALMYHLGKNAQAPILEIGPYMGGSTIAASKGLGDAGSSHSVVSVEMGGSYEHPTYATKDIVASLRANLDKYEVAERVKLFVGHSRDAALIESISRLGLRFGVMMIDADGHVVEDLMLYRRMLLPGCLLVVDDYFAPGAPEKEATTRHQLDELEQAGTVESFGVHGWGTWFGRMR
jgi:predicted O-methyltransferase YrrM